MKRQAVLGGLVVLSAFALPWQSASTIPDAKVDLKYVSPDGQTVEVVGIGEITPERYRFWNTQGALDNDLTKKVRDYYEGYDYIQFGFRYGVKNRYIVVKLSNAKKRVIFPKVRTMGQIGTYETSNTDAPVYEIFQLPFPKDLQMASLDANVPVLQTESVQLSLKPGSKATLAGSTFEMGQDSDKYPDLGIVQGNYVQYSYAIIENVPTWSVILGKSDPSQAVSEFSYELLDLNGKPIEWIDGRGDPVSKPNDVEKTLREIYTSKEPVKDASKIRQPIQQWVNPSINGAVRLTFSVNPKKIGSLRIKVAKYRFVLIEGIRLDPVE